MFSPIWARLPALSGARPGVTNDEAGVSSGRRLRCRVHALSQLHSAALVALCDDLRRAAEATVPTVTADDFRPRSTEVASGSTGSAPVAARTGEPTPESGEPAATGGKRGCQLGSDPPQLPHHSGHGRVDHGGATHRHGGHGLVATSHRTDEGRRPRVLPDVHLGERDSRRPHPQSEVAQNMQPGRRYTVTADPVAASVVSSSAPATPRSLGHTVSLVSRWPPRAGATRSASCCCRPS